VKVTEVQHGVLMALHEATRDGGASLWRGPRGSLERLCKKGLVAGCRKSGWALTVMGLRYVTEGRYEKRKKL
jgi:hypothetical protein